MSNKIYKTGIYARLSREDADRLESNSIQSQRAICLAYIEGHDDLELWTPTLMTVRPAATRTVPAFRG